jgi:hypothetical protein
MFKRLIVAHMIKYHQHSEDVWELDVAVDGDEWKSKISIILNRNGSEGLVQYRWRRWSNQFPHRMRTPS